MLFTKPLHEITFADIDAFCRAWPEGVRVEYKRELVARHIPKVVSSFANTGGGVWIIGVATGVDNLPVFPIRGVTREPGLEERITQTCYQNLYPPLLPEIKIIDVPGDPAKVIAVIQVPESVEAPHAVENTTKVYIRTNSTTEIIQLAEIDRIEYLLKRRREAELTRDDMLTQLARFSRLRDKIRVRIGPQYPHRPLLTRDLLTQRVKSIPGVRISPFVHPIREGYMAPDPHAARTFQDEVYFATNFHGMMVYEERLERSQHPRESGIGIIHLESVIYCIGQGFAIAKILLNEITENLKLEVLVEGIAQSTVVYMQGSYPREIDGYALDNTSSAEASLRSEQLNDSDFTIQLLVDLIYQLMWPFNWHNRDQIDSVVRGR
jgi:schlafen family protein